MSKLRQSQMENIEDNLSIENFIRINVHNTFLIQRLLIKPILKVIYFFKKHIQNKGFLK